MAPSIQACPPEITDQFIQDLDFSDIANLRLTSRSLARSSINQGYKDRFLAQTVDLTRESLNTFVKITQDGGLGCLVQDLTIVGIAIDISRLERMSREAARWKSSSSGVIVSSIHHKCLPQGLWRYNTEITGLRRQRQELDDLLETGEAVRLLPEALSNIRMHGAAGQLKSVTLSAVVRLENASIRKPPIESECEWKSIFQAAEGCFRTAMISISESHTMVERLDLFNSLRRCSLGLDELVSFPRPALAQVLRGVKSLAVSVSTGWREALDIDAGERLAELPYLTLHTVDEIVSLLELARDLEELEIHFYRVRPPNDNEVQRWGHEVVQDKNKVITLPRLRKVTLRGFAMTKQALMQFLETTKPKDLSLVGICLKEGSYAPVFAYCTSEEADLERFYFDDLFGGGMLHLYGVHRARFPLLGDERGSPRLERVGADVRVPIQVYRHQCWLERSLDRYVWQERRDMEEYYMGRFR